MIWTLSPKLRVSREAIKSANPNLWRDAAEEVGTMEEGKLRSLMQEFPWLKEALDKVWDGQFQKKELGDASRPLHELLFDVKVLGTTEDYEPGRWDESVPHRTVEANGTLRYLLACFVIMRQEGGWYLNDCLTADYDHMNWGGRQLNAFAVSTISWQKYNCRTQSETTPVAFALVVETTHRGRVATIYRYKR